MTKIADIFAVVQLEIGCSSGKFAPVLADFMKAVTDHADGEYPDAVEIVGDYALSADGAVAVSRGNGRSEGHG